MRIYNLVLEVTRKCNANCRHCLRGCAQNLDMTKEMLPTLFKDITGISSLVFSGGEVTLNVDFIKDTLEYVKANNIEVDSIYVVTNGVKYSQKLVQYMMEWFQYCCNEPIEYYLEENSFGLCLSEDEFHPEKDPQSELYKMFRFYRDDKVMDYKYGLIIEGSAKENNLQDEFTHCRYLNYGDIHDIMVDETIYVSAKGDVFANCDCSYETYDNFAMEEFNIFNNSIPKIIEMVEMQVA